MLSWNEIKDRALKFSHEFADARYEKGETQVFYEEFFNIFGVKRRSVAAFEVPVKKLGDKRGFIDLFWKGVLLVEQKSQGRSLKDAKEQADEYFLSLKEEERPRYILLSDFQTFELYDYETREEHKFALKDLYQNVELFGFIAGYEKKSYADIEVVNIEASKLMGKLYDELKRSGYPEHDLELFLTRILFCLFADDTGIWELNLLTQYTEERTNKDGSDLGKTLAHLFQILNTPENKRSRHLDTQLNLFTYINGGLFAQRVNIPDFNAKMREVFLECCYYDWKKVSPAIFGSLFQSVADPKKRRERGEHYTSETNIMKLIEPLFLDELWEEFEKVRTSKKKLERFHEKISNLKFLDPACGCGNFLVVTYREMRRLETQVILTLESFKKDAGQRRIDAASLSKLDVDNFYGIEIEEFPAKIAEVAMWMTDHLMNLELSEALGSFYTRIPLVKSANIVHANALRIDWKQVISPQDCNYILGNPPFVGHQYRCVEQQEDMKIVYEDSSKFGKLDYVCCWYYKAISFMSGTHIKAAFVSTNSIVQGEQVSTMWKPMFEKGFEIVFAHTSFAWNNEAKSKAAVHCVIVGFAEKDPVKIRRIYTNKNMIEVKNINGYLQAAPNVFIQSRGKPLTVGMPEMHKGSQPTDGGNLILSIEERDELIAQYPQTAKYIKRYVSADDFINDGLRYCLWLKGVAPTEYRTIKPIMQRLEKVAEMRRKSPTLSVRRDADTPMLFTQIRQPDTTYLVVPEVSSERRKYIPIGYLAPSVIASNRLYIVPEATLYLFGVLISSMHMAWMRVVCGRLEMRYVYTPAVYNNFPWVDVTDKQKAEIEKLAQAVLDARALFPESSLADLYDPRTMPSELVKAHKNLDRAVENLYTKKPFANERECVDFLFKLYEQYTKPLFA